MGFEFESYLLVELELSGLQLFEKGFALLYGGLESGLEGLLGFDQVLDGGFEFSQGLGECEVLGFEELCFLLQLMVGVLLIGE